MATAATTPVGGVSDFEELVLHKLIGPGQTVVDISDSGAEWIERAKSQHANIRALLYTPPEGESSAPEAATGQGTDLDGDMKTEGIRHIHFLKIGQASRVRRVLEGAAGLLRHSRIDYIQFPADTRDISTGQSIGKHLVENNYRLYKLECDEDGPDVCLVRFSRWDAGPPCPTISLLAVHERAVRHVVDPSANPFVNPFDLASRHVALKGVIHIGAHEGAVELGTYRHFGLKPCLMIEANPLVFERLEKVCHGDPDFIPINKAILDRSGPVELHVTNFDQASSLLKLGTSREIYSWLFEDRSIRVEGTTIDELLKERQLDPEQFNVINIDIQGAELLAFRGAKETLKHIDLLIAEVSFENLYEGCAQVDEVDDYLAQFGLRREATVSREHLSWGDAVYVKFPLPVRTLAGLPPLVSVEERS